MLTICHVFSFFVVFLLCFLLWALAPSFFLQAYAFSGPRPISHPSCPRNVCSVPLFRCSRGAYGDPATLREASPDTLQSRVELFCLLLCRSFICAVNFFVDNNVPLTTLMQVTETESADSAGKLYTFFFARNQPQQRIARQEEKARACHVPIILARAYHFGTWKTCVFGQARNFW